MRNTGLLAGFIPLIMYGVLAGQSVMSVEIALIVSLVAEAVFAWRDLAEGFILAWATIFIFGSSLIAIGVFHATALVPCMGIFIYLTLASVAFGSVIMGMPFTLQYARRMVDKSFWDRPLFRKVNTFMSAVWGLVFFINLMLSVTGLYLPEYSGIFLVLTWISLIAGVLFTVFYPGYIGKKVQIKAETG